MSVIYDLEENFTIYNSEIETLKPIIEDWLRQNDFTVKTDLPARVRNHLICADRNCRRGIGMRPKIRNLQIIFTQNDKETEMSVKIIGFRHRNKYDYWTILVRLFSHLRNRLEDKGIDQIMDHLMNEEYNKYLETRGKILLK
jgi:hypothetical protein